MGDLRFRQVHLDFHTTEAIAGIGSEFDPERFFRTLKDAAVDSITCFSRCHHGWIYHETKFPYRHPHLTTNLLEQQIRACHAADIRVPIYITVGWDDLMARLHPEWIEVDADGKQVGRAPLGTGGWKNLDFASPYVDFVIEQTQEVCDLFGDEVDGFFFDIIFQQGVHSVWCLEKFRQLGLDPANQAHQAEMRERVVDECVDRLYGAVRDRNKSCSVFFNSGHVGPSFRRRLRGFTHLEIESLPTGGWGYMHFPLTSRYARTLGLDFLGMTGKFSETWGHFASYKHPAALEFECFSALAQGGKCSVGDQLPPNGKLDRKTYELIGHVYRQIRDVEPWCVGAKPLAEIAVMNLEAFRAESRMDPSNWGAARMLIEGRHQFDLIDPETDLSGYRVVILPDAIPVEGELAQKLNAFVAAGGALICSGTSGFPPGSGRSPLEGYPAELDGPRPFAPEFLVPGKGLSRDTDTTFVMYERGQTLRPVPGSEVLAGIVEPYFQRDYARFCSHAHTPPKEGSDGGAAVVRKGRIAHFAHPIFETYYRHTMGVHRDLVLAVLDRLLPNPLVRIEGPSTLQATVTAQGDRRLVHLLHYIPERRGERLDVVEDPMPIPATEVRLRSEGAMKASLVPQGVELPTRFESGYICAQLPDGLAGHQIVCFEPA